MIENSCKGLTQIEGQVEPAFKMTGKKLRRKRCLIIWWLTVLISEETKLAKRSKLVEAIKYAESLRKISR